MLTYQDCVALCDLTEAEIRAIAEHEHVPYIVAAEIGNYLVHNADGTPMIRRMILDDLNTARSRGDARREVELKLVLKHFIETHPANRPA
ncbi:MAG: hypothetical protein HOH66_15250 [Rhodospirillaceae bacterium]|jgi:hypothetical protein|nr:hypothetical protein [Rhodospirillaceae bacterium]MBT6119217.1 hypothetical protein [Rhodospirillaceae bacterium]